MSGPRVYRVSSLVIRQRDLGEADRIVSLYTLERGKLSAVAKGVRKTPSRLAGGLQLFAHARTQLAAGRSLEVVTQVQPLDVFYHLRDDMRRYAHASYAAELLDTLVDEGAADPELFALLLSTFRGLNEGGDPLTLRIVFELRLLAGLGYGPELTNCIICRAEVGAGKAGFSVAEGGIMCGACAGVTGGAPVAPEAVRAMRDIVRLSPEELTGRRLSAAVGRELERVLSPFVEYHLPRPLRSAEFLQS